MKTKVIKLELDENKRCLFISDIHGDLDLFLKALDKVKFNDNDYLFLLGDLIEKSNTNLKFLDYMMEFSKKKNVFILCGNCDNVLSFLIPPVDGSILIYYALDKKFTIINEFTGLLNEVITPDTDMNILCSKIYKDYRKYFDFILNLPHVFIINDKIYCCHGGIDDINNISETPLDLMKYDDFYEKCPNNLEKPLIVGHFPTINYNQNVPSLNPIIDLKKNIISIDGGNNLVPYSQLNILIVDNVKAMNFHYNYVDNYNKCLVLKNQNELKESFNLTYGNLEVLPIKEVGDYFLCENNNHEIYVLKELIKYDELSNRYRAYAGFNFFPTLLKNDKIELIFKRNPFSVIKKDGIVGLVLTNDIEEV